MSGIRVLAGTRKGAFILTSDGKRKNWKVDGPHFAGWEIYHMKGSPVDQNRIYASQTSAWFGQIIQRSDDGGKSWSTPGGGPATNPEGMPMGESNKFVYDGVPGTHQWYDGTQHPWEFKRVWHLEPSLQDSNHVFAGVEDAALFHSKDGGATWGEAELDPLESRWAWRGWRFRWDARPGEYVLGSRARDEAGNPLSNAEIYASEVSAAPGERVERELDLRGPIPPGPYRLAFDLVDEQRFWLAELGNYSPELDVEVAPRIDARTLAVEVHGPPDATTSAALAAPRP